MELNKTNAVVTSIIELSPGVIYLKVAPEGFPIPDFKPGQYGTLGVLSGQPRHELAEPDKSTFKPKGWDTVIVRRPYSITSSPTEKNFVEFYISMVLSGAVTPKIFTLKVGDEVFLSEKFGGLFTLDDVNKENDLILACTGTGIAPYISMIRSNSDWGQTDKKVTLMHGVRHSADLGYRGELETIASERENFFYIPIVSRALEEPSDWTGEVGHIQDNFAESKIEEVFGYNPNPMNTSILLCGNPDMIKETTVILESNGFLENKRKSPGNIHSEKYW